MSEKKDPSRIPFALTNFFSVVAMVLSLYRSHIPGGSDANALGFLLWILVGPAWIFCLYIHYRKASGTQTTQPIKRRLLIVPMMIGLSVLPMIQLPMFLSFTLFRQYLETEARNTTKREPSPNSLSDGPKHFAGPFPVYDSTIDDKGATWIVTSVRGEGVGPDLLYEGFVLKPSGSKTPYGRKHYDKTGPLRMKDGWYTFQVSDDY
jgi:hypothetical protein